MRSISAWRRLAGWRERRRGRGGTGWNQESRGGREKDDGAFGTAGSKEGGDSAEVATAVGWLWLLRLNAPSKWFLASQPRIMICRTRTQRTIRRSRVKRACRFWVASLMATGLVQMPCQEGGRTGARVFRAGLSGRTRRRGEAGPGCGGRSLRQIARLGCDILSMGARFGAFRLLSQGAGSRVARLCKRLRARIPIITLAIERKRSRRGMPVGRTGRVRAAERRGRISETLWPAQALWAAAGRGRRRRIPQALCAAQTVWCQWP